MQVAEERIWRTCPGGVAHASVRAFGENPEDLDLDFALPRPELVTRLLAQCVRPQSGAWPEDELWSWTLAQRLQGLLAIALASGVARLSVVEPCANCAEGLEIEVEPTVFEREERLTAFDWSPVPEQVLSVSLPTGREQQAWWQAGDVSVEAMARRLVFGRDDGADDDALSSDWIEALGAQLAQHDPLTALELQAACPACGAETRIPLDLEVELLKLLQARQRHSLLQIHLLANAYHWSEAAIMRLPAWRRRFYLMQVGGAP
jgi:hypothetical protein